MAYNNKYFAGWESRGRQGYLYIDEVDFIGSPEQLRLLSDGFRLNIRFNDWNDPIIGTQVEFNIVNETANFFDLLPLTYAEERQFKVRIVETHPTTNSLFEGYINCEPITQKLLLRNSINFVASGYLYKLENHHPASIDTLQTITFIDIINEILNSTGQSFPVRVNCELVAEGDVKEVGQTLFNKNGFYTELFWENETDRKSALYILRSILTSYDCYIYWLNGVWYIERYEDIWKESKTFVEYQPNVAYSPISTGTVVEVTETIKSVHALRFINLSQTLKSQPGLKTIRVNLNDARFLNLTRNEFKSITKTKDDVDPLEPDLRNWIAWTDTHITWSDEGLPKSVISNSIKRTIAYSDFPSPEWFLWWYGLFTKFKVTVDADDVKLQIKFKYVVDPQTISWIIDENEPGFTTWGDYDFHFHWYLRNLPGDYYISNSGNSWKKMYAAGMGYYEGQNKYIQKVTVNGSSFDTINNSVEVSITVPLGLVDTYQDDLYAGKLRGDQTLILCIGLETILATTTQDTFGPHAKSAWYGDVEITCSGGLQNNVIEASPNNKFLNKKEIDLDLYDVINYNYKNAILRGNDLSIRTERWGILGGDAVVLEKGLVWATHNNPTVSDNKIINGTGFANFSQSINGLSENTTYYVKAYAIDGTGIKYGSVKSFTTGAVAIGQYYRGGVIGYIYVSGDPGYIPGEVHGIIAAIADQGVEIYGRLSGGGPYTSGAYDTALGTGDNNTADLMANTFQNPYAVKLCYNYENEGYTDWVFPALNELQKLYLSKRKIGGFKDGWYWSSSERESGGGFLGLSWWKYARAIHFGNGKNDSVHKHESFNIRAIRYF